MSTLTENVSLTITIASVGIARAGFGIMLILSHNAAWVERTRTYGGISDVAADFAAGTPEYIAANAAFAQSPHPQQVMIGRASNKPTQQYTIGATAFNSTLYGINVTAPGATPVNPVSYTSDSTATVNEIHNGLVTALNAVTGKNYTATFAPFAFTAFTFTVLSQAGGTLTATAHPMNTGDGPVELTTSTSLPTGLSTLTDYWIIKVDANTIQFATSLANALAGTFIVLSSNGTGTQTCNPDTTLSPFLPFLVTGNAVGNWFSLEVLNYALLSNKQTHADPGIATDLDAILLESDAWYGLHTMYNSKALVLAAAAWVEAQPRLYVASVVDTDAINVVVGSGTDTLAALFGLTYNRTAGAYYPSPAAAFAAAWMGRMFPDQPGSATWIDKTLAGVAATKLNTTHRTNLKARKASYYVSIAGVNKTQGGTVAGGTFNYVDVTQGLDWLQDDMTKSVYEALAGMEKIPFTDPGIAVIRSEMKSSLKRAAGFGIITEAFVIQVPSVANVAASDKALRQLPNMLFSCVLQGAIHRVVITGVVTF